jgi:hypothetical protein
MKKTIITLFIGILIGSALGISALGATQKIEAVLMDVKFLLNGEVVEFDNKPLVYNERTYIPIREAAELLNLEVGWDQEKQMVVLNSNENSSGSNNTDQNNNNNSNNNINNSQNRGVNNINNNIFYNFFEVNRLLSNKYTDERSAIWGDVKNNTIVKTYLGIDYPVNESNYFYDRNTNIQYLEENYLLQFLQPEDLEGATKYIVDFEQGIVTPIK